MRRMLAALLALGASLFTGAVPALAQQEAYEFTPPPGWLTTRLDGGALNLTPPGASAGEAAIIIVPVEPLGPDFHAQAVQARAKYESAMNLRDPAMTPAQRGQSAAGDHLLVGGTYSMMQNGRAEPLHALFYARGSNGAFGFAMFITGTAEHYAAHGSGATALFNSLRLKAGAAEIAASRLKTQQPQPSAPQQPDVAGTAAAVGRDRLYNQCVANCGGRLLVCSSGNAFKPGSQYSTVCADQNRNCLTGCMIFK